MKIFAHFSASFMIIFVGLSMSLSAQTFEQYQPSIDTLLNSTNLGYDKAISITLPRELVPGSDHIYPLIIIFDQQNQRSFNFLLRTIDYLTSNEQMPASVIAGIASTMDKRYQETQWPISDSAGFADKTEAFIFEELIPMLKSTCQVGDFLLLTGHSRYGFFTSTLLAKYPETIDAVISLSPFFQQSNMNVLDSINLAFSGTNVNHKVYYRFGMGRDFPKDYEAVQQLLANHNFPMLDAKGEIFPQADHNVTPGLIVGSALYDIFSYWSKIQNRYIADPELLSGNLEELMDSIVMQYGTKIPISLGILNGKGWALYGIMKYDQAIEAWEVLLHNYPEFSEAYLYIAMARKELNMEFATYVDKFRQQLKRSKFYTEEEKKQLLQEYEADIDMLFKE
ncbi:MAG: alpha/beta hydrolase-fold protein [Lentimicrobium sp.]|jgi:predicted alpha/beta superfamily hydrolase|nr:alpha/beta hydrolase-fold protein [Lentimicrobium sp.]